MKKTSKPVKPKLQKVQTSISLRMDILSQAQAMAKKEGRSLSNWIEQKILGIYDGAGPPSKRIAK